MSAPGLTIGKLARTAGVNIETIRYYQRVGLIKEPDKPVQGFRHYPPAMVARVRFIKRAQRLGFTLKEIAELLSLGDGHCAQTRELAEQKRALIDAHIADLSAMRDTLDELIESCKENRTTNGCPIVEALTASRER